MNKNLCGCYDQRVRDGRISYRNTLQAFRRINEKRFSYHHAQRRGALVFRLLRGRRSRGVAGGAAVGA